MAGREQQSTNKRSTGYRSASELLSLCVRCFASKLGFYVGLLNFDVKLLCLASVFVSVLEFSKSRSDFVPLSVH